MYRENLVARWPNGDLEGFTGMGSTAQAAKDAALRKARRKYMTLNDIEPRGDVLTQPVIVKLQILDKYEYKALTSEQKAELENDWKLSAIGKGEY